MLFTVLVVLANIAKVFTCPRMCTCSESLSVINCANLGLEKVPEDFEEEMGFRKLNLAHNDIEDLMLEDIQQLQIFEVVDIRCNPMNCTSLMNFPMMKPKILTDCRRLTSAHPTAPATSTATMPRKITDYSGMTNGTMLAANLSSHKNNQLLVFGIAGAAVFCFLCVLVLIFVYFHRRGLHHVITREALSMETFELTSGSESSEDELFLKEKQL